MKEKVINCLTYILTIILVIGILLFQNDIKKVFIFGSVMAFFLGILMVLRENKIGFLVTALGFSGVVTFFIYEREILDFNDSVTFMVCLSVALMVVLTDIFMVRMRKMILKKFNIILLGEVIDLEKNKNTRKEFYKIIYRYDIGGMEYIVEDPRYKKSNLPAIGDKREILVDPENLESTYFLPSKQEDLMVIVASLVFVIGAIGIIISILI